MHLLRCYPRITDWLFEVSGGGLDFRFIPMYSYGFFVAMGFLAAAAIAGMLLRKREKLGLMPFTEEQVLQGKMPDWKDLLPLFITWFLVFMKVGGMFSEKELFSADPQSYIFSLHGNYLIGIIAAVLLTAYQYFSLKKNALPEPVKTSIKIYPSDRIGDLVVVAAILGVIGANLFDMIENPDGVKEFLDDPFGSLFSGLSVFGGLIVAGLGFFLYARKYNIPTSHLFDAVAPGYALANGIGRIGCHVSGDGDWGIPNTLAKPSWLPEFLWRDDYAHNILTEGVRMPDCSGAYCTHLVPAVFPTPLWEFSWLAAICLLLIFLDNRLMKTPWSGFGLFLILLGIQRFTIEQWRASSERTLYQIGGFPLRQAEIISLGMMLGGIVLLLWLFYFRKKNQAA